jgi:hypothetical protein
VLVTDGLVSSVPAPVRNRRQRADIAVLCHYLPHSTLQRLAPNMGEAEEGERGTIRLRQKLTTEPRWQIRPSFGTQSEE